MTLRSSKMPRPLMGQLKFLLHQASSPRLEAKIVTWTHWVELEQALLPERIRLTPISTPTHHCHYQHGAQQCSQSLPERFGKQLVGSCWLFHYLLPFHLTLLLLL